MRLAASLLTVSPVSGLWATHTYAPSNVVSAVKTNFIEVCRASPSAGLPYAPASSRPWRVRDERCTPNLYRVPTQIVFSNSLCFPCVFPVRLQIFPVPIYKICEYYIHRTDLADQKKWIFLQQLLQYPLLLESEHLQLELTEFPVFFLCLNKIPCVLIFFSKFPVFSLCFDFFPKFPVFSLTGIFFGHFPCFPCAVGTLLYIVVPFFINLF